MRIRIFRQIDWHSIRNLSHILLVRTSVALYSSMVFELHVCDVAEMEIEDEEWKKRC